MPYSNISELPKNLDILPEHAKQIFMAAFNSAFKEYKDDVRARRVAWAAVKNKFQKDKDGKWVAKSTDIENDYGFADMYFTKSTVSADGEMLWSATASDIYPDVFNERMSLDLYRSFIENFNAGNPLKIFVSLSHYPSLDGKAEAGQVTHLFIDGDKLKAKGIFYDTRLGRAIFESIKRDRTEKVDPNNRVRVSIGFYALKFRVGDADWEYGKGLSMPQPKNGEVKVYLKGVLEHLAVTRSPANLRANIKAYLADMVEKSEMPLTRAQDALSVVGKENADLVEEFETTLQNQPVKRSYSPPLVEKYDINVDLVLTGILQKLKNFVILVDSEKDYLLNVLYGDGSLSNDEMSQRLGYLLSNITTRSEVKEEVKVADEVKSEVVQEIPVEIKKDDMGMVENEAPEVYKPFGGATSIDQALQVIDAEKMADKMYRAYSLLGAVTGNILTSDLAPEEKMTAMSDCLDKAKSLFTSEELIKLSVVDRADSITEPVVSETSQGEVVKEDKLWTPLLTRVDEILANVVNLSTPERREGLQNLINEFATGLSAVDIEIDRLQTVQKSGNVQPATENSTITQDVLANVLGQLSAQLDARFETRMAETNNQIAALSQQLSQIATALNGNVVARTVVKNPQPQQFQQPVINSAPVPVAKSINYQVQETVNQGGFNNERKMSIRDIVSKTTFIPGR